MKSSGRVARLMAGLISFLFIGVLLLSIYCYLDFQRLKQTERYASPQEAFVAPDASPELEVTIDHSRGETLAIGDTILLSCDDVWFVEGHYVKGGDRKWGGSPYFLVDDGWVRVSETSPTPFVVCIARKIADWLD